MGFLICDITVTGRSAYFGVPELGVDALKASHAMLSALFAHSAALEAQAPHPLVGHPFLLVTDAGGRGLYRGSRRMPDQPDPEADARRKPRRRRTALEDAVRWARLDPAIRLAFDYPAGRDHRFGGTPTETLTSTPFVRLLIEAVKRSAGSRRDRRRALLVGSAIPGRALGAPTVYCAPGDIRNCHTLEERVEVQEYLDGIVAFAAFLAALGEEPAFDP